MTVHNSIVEGNFEKTKLIEKAIQTFNSFPVAVKPTKSNDIKFEYNTVPLRAGWRETLEQVEPPR